MTVAIANDRTSGGLLMLVPHEGIRAVSGGTSSNITINKSTEKAFELFERMIAEKNAEIERLKNKIS